MLQSKLIFTTSTLKVAGSVVSEILFRKANIVRCTSTSAAIFGRTQWSYTRPRNTDMTIEDLPRRLRDGKFYRNQSKSGRGEDGRIKIQHKGGGHQRNFRIVDTVRVPVSEPGQEPKAIKDRILQIGYDPFRTAHIAHVAGNGGNQTKLILCPHETKVGDILTASRGKPASLARMIPGDAYPLEYLPLGTMVHSIEKLPGEGGIYCRAAGTYATLLRKSDDIAVLKCPDKRRPQLTVSVKCLAVIGRASNINKKHEIIGKAGRSRWLNRKPRGQTGKDRWHHKKKVR